MIKSMKSMMQVEEKGRETKHWSFPEERKITARSFTLTFLNISTNPNSLRTSSRSLQRSLKTVWCIRPRKSYFCHLKIFNFRQNLGRIFKTDNNLQCNPVAHHDSQDFSLILQGLLCTFTTEDKATWHMFRYV